jgi:hypothetical protein
MVSRWPIMMKKDGMVLSGFRNAGVKPIRALEPVV